MSDILLPPKPGYALFSGGKDSFTATDVVAEADMLKGCVLIDTGIAADTWKDDVIAICEKMNWPYKIVPTNVRYEWFVWKFGFPGPGMHKYVMRYLKGRAVAQWKQQHNGEILISGVRSEESNRRGHSAKYESTWEGVKVYAPIVNWSTEETIKHGMERNYQKPRTYYTLGISGDCLCGAFAQEHEPEAMAEHCPKVFNRICSMQAKGSYTWGQRSIDGVDKTLPLFGEAETVGCSDCWRGKR